MLERESQSSPEQASCRVSNPKRSALNTYTYERYSASYIYILMCVYGCMCVCYNNKEDNNYERRGLEIEREMRGYEKSLREH